MACATDDEIILFTASAAMPATGPEIIAAATGMLDVTYGVTLKVKSYVLVAKPMAPSIPTFATGPSKRVLCVTAFPLLKTKSPLKESKLYPF